MFRFAILSALALGVVSVSAVAHPDAEALIGTAASELTRGAFTAEEIDDVVATGAIARFTLGRHANRLPDADVARFTTAFERFVDEAFEDQAHRFAGADVHVIGSTDRSARDSVVTTRITLPGEAPETVRWRVINRGGDWRIVDLQVQGLWLAIEQRAQVAAILDRTGGNIDAAIETIGEASEDYADANRARRRG